MDLSGSPVIDSPIPMELIRELLADLERIEKKWQALDKELAKLEAAWETWVDETHCEECGCKFDLNYASAYSRSVSDKRKCCVCASYSS